MYPYIYIIVPSYALLAVIGGFVTLVFVYSRIEKFQVEFSELLQCFIVGIIGIIVGSKLLFAITQIPWLIHNFSVKNMLLLIPQSGYVFYGGLLGCIFSIWMYTKKKPEYRERIFRLIVPGFPLFHIFGRVGCFLSGCCYGKELDTKIIIGIVAFKQIPIQLIEALMELVIFISILVIDKKNKEVNLLSRYLLMYACVRFVLEFLRGDALRGIWLGISTSQWISLSIVAYYLTVFVKGKIITED